MFTIRIELGNLQRSVVSCNTYAVHQQIGDGVILYLDREPGETDGGREVVIAPGCFAYVMNEKGVTIDVIRTMKPKKAEMKHAAVPEAKV
jgi:hypothetical protein